MVVPGLRDDDPFDAGGGRAVQCRQLPGLAAVPGRSFSDSGDYREGVVAGAAER
jgi:hypothetical protein